MYGKSFAIGMGMGLAAGAMLGAAMAPKKKGMLCGSSKFMKGLGDIIEDITDMIG